MKGLKIDSNGLPVRAGSGLDFSAEDLPGTTFDSGLSNKKGSGISSIPVAAFRSRIEFTQRTPLPQPICTRLDISRPIPARGHRPEHRVVAVRVPSTDLLNGEGWTYAFGDRLLFVTSAFNAESRMTVVWRRGLD